MPDPTTSLMMKFETLGGAVVAECPLVIDTKDTLANTSVAMHLVGSTVTVPKFRMASNGKPGYFLISTFNFGCTLSGEERKTGRRSAGAAAPRGPSAGIKARIDALGMGRADKAKDNDADSDSDADAKSSGSFARWRSMTPDDDSKQPRDAAANDPSQLYASEIESFTFTRLIDSATSTLLKACCDSKSFKSASLIKRRPAAVGAKDGPIDVAFLRIDFADVKITSLNFADGDVVTETCTFTSSAVQITYGQQSASGALTFLPAVSWKAPMADLSQRQYI